MTDKAVVNEAEALELLKKLFAEDPALEEKLKRIGGHLYFADDIVLVVLKGHLLVEEQLTTIIRKFVPHGEFIDDANLRFFQKVQIARSLSWDEHQNDMWDLVIGLNKVRNDMAHALEHPKVEAHISSLRACYFEIFADSERAKAEKDARDADVLKSVVVVLTGFLAQFEKEVERFRWWVSIIDRFVNPHRHRQPKAAGRVDTADVESQ